MEFPQEMEPRDEVLVQPFKHTDLLGQTGRGSVGRKEEQRGVLLQQRGSFWLHNQPGLKDTDCRGQREWERESTWQAPHSRGEAMSCWRGTLNSPGDWPNTSGFSGGVKEPRQRLVAGTSCFAQISILLVPCKLIVLASSCKACVCLFLLPIVPGEVNCKPEYPHGWSPGKEYFCSWEMLPLVSVPTQLDCGVSAIRRGC